MKVGVNYTPPAGWFHSWLDLDLSQIRRDFEAIANLGLDHVRIFPLWTLLQPNRGLIRPRALEDVRSVVSAAGEVGLDVWVDALNGHLSSFEFLPAWVITWHQRNLFTNPEVVSSQCELVAALARVLREEPAAQGIGVGNEFGQFAASRHPAPNQIGQAEAISWLRALLGAAEENWPDGRHSHSFDDDLWFTDSHPFTPAHATNFGAMTTVHSWVFTSSWDNFTDPHPHMALFARYLLELAAGWAKTNRTLWLQEVGAPSPHIGAEQAPDFLEKTLRHASSMPGLEAVTWWCSHDVSRTLLDFPELEYTLGLFDAAGRVKPIGARLAEMIADLKKAEPLAPQRAVIEFDAGIDRAGLKPGGEVFARWSQAALAGEFLALRPRR